jgi:hypothetical protein
MVVKIEFLADRDDVPNQRTTSFDDCESLGAVNLRGTGFVAKDWELRTITADIDGEMISIEIRVATVPAYILAKVHAAHGRSLPKDCYDIAYVLLHNDEGGPLGAARRVHDRFGDQPVGPTKTALSELSANFTDAEAQGSVAYASTMIGLYPDLDNHILLNDAVAAVITFLAQLNGNG